MLMAMALTSAIELSARDGSGFGWGFGTGVATGAIVASANRPRYVYVDDNYYGDRYYDEDAALRAENRRLRRELARREAAKKKVPVERYED